LDNLIDRMIRGTQLSGHQVSFAKAGLSVTAKPLALKRAVGNLLDNALHYGEKVEISTHAAGNFIEIRIRDHGPGVPDNAFGSLFEPYVRLAHGRDRNENGMGLGLGIARDIVHAHGGELVLANHPEGGLVATIRLPA
jgi:signal transduction histidine kinase